MNELKVFENNQFGKLNIMIIDGKEYFPATDCAKVLGYSNPHKAIGDHCRALTKREVIDNLGRTQEMNFIPEGDLYRLIARSKLPAAEQFERWVFDEVLPSIRKHGGYLTPDKMEEALLNPDVLIRLATDLKNERAARIAVEQERAALAGKVEQDAPKVLFADSVTASKQSILVGELAKLLRQNGVNVGQNRMFEWLRRDGYLHRSGVQRNMPTQRAMDMVLFEVQERTINNPDGSVRLTRTPKITGKGQVYFLNKYIVLADKKGKAV